jgi:hypothetical protein
MDGWSQQFLVRKGGRGYLVATAWSIRRKREKEVRVVPMCASLFLPLPTLEARSVVLYGWRSGGRKKRRAQQRKRSLSSFPHTTHTHTCADKSGVEPTHPTRLQGVTLYMATTHTRTP